MTKAHNRNAKQEERKSQTINLKIQVHSQYENHLDTEPEIPKSELDDEDNDNED